MTRRERSLTTAEQASIADGILSVLPARVELDDDDLDGTWGNVAAECFVRRGRGAIVIEVSRRDAAAILRADGKAPLFITGRYALADRVDLAPRVRDSVTGRETHIFDPQTQVMMADYDPAREYVAVFLFPQPRRRMAFLAVTARALPSPVHLN